MSDEPTVDLGTVHVPGEFTSFGIVALREENERLREEVANLRRALEQEQLRRQDGNLELFQVAAKRHRWRMKAFTFARQSARWKAAARKWRRKAMERS